VRITVFVPCSPHRKWKAPQKGHHLASNEAIYLHIKFTASGPRSALYKTDHPATPAATNTLATTLKGLQPPTPSPNFA